MRNAQTAKPLLPAICFVVLLLGPLTGPAAHLSPADRAAGSDRKGERAATISGYLREVPPEAPADREARLRRVAARRKGPIVIVHRGAAAFAPENTLEAYAAAVDYGADGCEVVLRRSADGVPVLFHDDMLDRLTNGFGTVSGITYYELLALEPARVYGTATKRTRPPTFAALLALARQRAMLLHLDVKEPGLEPDLERLLEAAGAWDHVVAVNPAFAPRLARDPRVKPLAYRGPGLYADRRDVDPEAVREQLGRPGQMIMVDDPRVAAWVLGRPPYEPVPLPPGLREEWPRRLSTATSPAGDLVPSVYLRRRAGLTDPASRRQLLALLRSGPADERGQPAADPASERARTERILDRAWAALRLGETRRGSPDVIRALQDQVRRRSLHRDWMYHGLDGAMAARALGMLRATEAASTLVEAFLRVDPALERVRDTRFGRHPLAWTDFRLKMHLIPALGELRCPESQRFLQTYLEMAEEEARELAPPVFEEATRALMRQHRSRAETEALLRSRHGAVRGTALLECLDRPSRKRTAALRAAAPWALALPPAADTPR